MYEGLTFIEQFPYSGLFLLLVLGCLGLPFPEDATLILCGFLISSEVIKLVPALIVVYSGVLLTDVAMYSFGRKYGRRIVTHPRFHRVISPERLSWLEKKFNKGGIFFILIGRHFVGLRGQIFIAAGVMRMALAKFLIADAFSSMVTIAVMVAIGYGGGSSFQAIRTGMTRVEHVVIFVLFAALVIYLLVQYVKYSRRPST